MSYRHMKGIYKLEELTWKQLEGIDRARAVVLLPASPLEEHGPHLPLGVDFLHAAHFTKVLAEELVRRRPEQLVLVHPPVPLGTWTLDFLGSIEIRQRVVRDLVVDVGRSLAKHGFRHLVVMNGHGGPGHLVAQEEACATLCRRHGMRAIAPVGRMIDRLFTGKYSERIREAVRARGGADVDLSCMSSDFHAGMIETSLMLHVRPDLVADGWKEFPPVCVERHALRPSSGAKAGEGLGYLGHPARASAEIGAAVSDVAVTDLTEVVERLLDGADVAGECRSPYHRIPLFWTDAKLYAAGVALCVLAMVWHFLF
jgi:creatinine amidohydrolase